MRASKECEAEIFQKNIKFLLYAQYLFITVHLAHQRFDHPNSPLPRQGTDLRFDGRRQLSQLRTEWRVNCSEAVHRRQIQVHGCPVCLGDLDYCWGSKWDLTLSER